MKSLMVWPLALLAFSPARTAFQSGHLAEVRGAAEATVAGQAVFGSVHSSTGSFSLELGAYSDGGAVVFSRVSSTRPKVGTYRVAPFDGGPESDGEFHALVSLGSVTAPSGSFRAVSGTVTITQSSEDRVVGHYEVKAIGFLAAQPEIEDRMITVRGGFAAEPSAMASRYSAAVHGALQGNWMGDASFGSSGRGSGGIFSLSLGAYGAQGGILLSRFGAGRPQPGVYRVRELASIGPDEFHGVISTGGPAQPSGVFHARAGNLTITSSTAERLTGTFELQGIGFLADSPDNEGREVLVSGSFSATATGTTLNLTVR